MTFAWARRGNGARELSRSLVFDATSDAALAGRLCSEFTNDVVARLPEPGFQLDRGDIIGWLRDRG